MNEQVLAIDIGGTKIAVALVAADGTILHERIQPTVVAADPEAVFEPAAIAVREVLAEAAPLSEQLSVGIGSAGPIDAPGGTISPVNILCWREFPVVERVRQVVKEATGVEPRVGLAGDGHCFALGEHWLGAAREVESMVGMVVSTGVGGGAVLQNKLFTGRTGNAVHIGHVSVNAWGPRCVCGCHGCVERYARGPALVAAAQQAGWRGGEDAKALTADARKGDPIALDTIDAGMRALAAGIATTATLLDVTTFVIGGGVAKAGDVIFEPLRRHLADFAVLHYVDGLEVRPAELPNAGLLGAAALAFSLD